MSLTAQMIEILRFKFPVEFNSFNIGIGDPGTGAIITYWNVSGVPQPDESQILAWVTDPTYIYNRAMFYRYNDPTLGFKAPADELITLYKSLVDNTTDWTDHMGAVIYQNYPLDGNSVTPPSINKLVTEDELTNYVSTSSLSNYLTIVQYNNKPIVIANNTTTQSISGTGKVTVNMNTEMYDADNLFSTNTFIAPKSGIYEISGFANLDNVAILSLLNTYDWELYITQSGSNNTSYLLDRYSHGILAAIKSSVQGTRLISLAQNDTIMLQIQKTNSSALNLYNAYLNIKWVK